MNNEPKLNILMFSMSRYSDWQKGVVNRNYHILHTLEKNEQVNKIITVDFLPFTWKRAIKAYLSDQVLRDTQGEIVYGDLTSTCWQVSEKILTYSTVDSVINPKRIIAELNKIIAKENMTANLVVWNYNPLYADYFGQFGQKLNIFDAVDNWQKHSGYKNYKEKLSRNYQKILDKSDLIFTVSQNLKEKLFQNNTKVRWVPNGVDLEFFQSQTNISEKLKDIPQPIIGFLGILQDRIDTELIKYLAQNNPAKSVVLAGPVWKGFPKDNLSRYENIHFLGPIKYSEIPSLYNGFGVGIITYKNNEFIKSTDPMKFYEYLAAGLPVVATPTPGTERFGDLIQVAATPQEFNQKINKAIGQKVPKEKITEILKENTWDKRVGDMLSVISSLPRNP